MRACIAQWIGCREKQEDSYRVKYYPDGVLAVVADGMGGHRGGELASAVAVQEFESVFSASAELCPRERLSGALAAANSAVGAVLGGVGGTTLVAAFICCGVMWWVSVGDSPLLIWRSGRLQRLNADHSLRAVLLEYVSAGTMTYMEAMQRGHQLRSALTGEPLTLVDSPCVPLPLLPGDRILVASDGVDALLLAPVLPHEVRAILSTPGGNPAVSLVGVCSELAAPVADNVTVVCVDCE